MSLAGHWEQRRNSILALCQVSQYRTRSRSPFDISQLQLTNRRTGRIKCLYLLISIRINSWHVELQKTQWGHRSKLLSYWPNHRFSSGKLSYMSRTKWVMNAVVGRIGPAAELGNANDRIHCMSPSAHNRQCRPHAPCINSDALCKLQQPQNRTLYDGIVVACGLYGNHAITQRSFAEWHNAIKNSSLVIWMVIMTSGLSLDSDVLIQLLTTVLHCLTISSSLIFHTFQTYCLIIILCSLYLSLNILVISLTMSLKIMMISDDIKREIRNLFMRTNVLVRRFAKCSVPVKLVLFKTYTVYACMMLLSGMYIVLVPWTSWIPLTTSVSSYFSCIIVVTV